MIVKYRGEEIDVEYDVIVITAINYKDVDIMPILSEEEIDLIYEEVYENYD